MTNNIIKQLAEHDIYGYGSSELLKFENHMARYFEREYERWRGNANKPEDYGVSSFKGDTEKKETHAEYIGPYNKDLNVYKTFLDKEYMSYSMAYYGVTEYPNEIDKNMSLEQAQIEKFKLIIGRADIRNGHNVLDLGCGFGGFSKYLLQTFPDISVTGVNPSIVQTQYTRTMLQNYNLRFNLVQKHIGDLSNTDIPHGSFDRVVSIGALEHFSNFDSLFKYLRKILKPGGKCFHHVIVSVGTIPQILNAENTLMSSYFPGGHIWPYDELKRHTKHLEYMDSWYINGMNYWKTLDEWHKRFWERIGNIYPEYLSIDDVDYWNKYFTLCKAMFSPDCGRSYGNGQYLYFKHS